jgi:hypothetical protein
MKPKRFVTMIFLSVILVSIGLVLAGAAGSESADPNAVPVPRLSGVPADRVEWNAVEGHSSNLEDCQEAVLRELVGATEEQWRQIGPKLREFEAVQRRTQSSIGVFAGGGAGFGEASGVASSGRNADSPRRSYQDAGRRRTTAPRQSVRPSAGTSPSISGWLRPSERRAGGQIKEGERLCEQLLGMINRADVSAEEIREKMAQLATYRRQAHEEIKEAQQALRLVVNRRQEAMLILMGYLD